MSEHFGKRGVLYSNAGACWGRFVLEDFFGGLIRSDVELVTVNTVTGSLFGEQMTFSTELVPASIVKEGARFVL